MKVFCHNFNPNSDSGPNKFTRQLFKKLSNMDVVTVVDQKTADIEFCLIHLEKEKVKPMLLRLDGIYFNSDQDYDQQNLPIKYAYDSADHVVFQSHFNKDLTNKWFGHRENTSVVHNAPDMDFISSVDTKKLETAFDKELEVWSCASSWRPHKRLKENLKYFYEKAPSNAVMVVAGNNADIHALKKYNSLTNGRIYYLGNLNYFDLISLYKRSSTFVHLAYLDHCPNVVVDAQAAGCDIVCASSGGTSEIVNDGVIVKDEPWDYSPTKLYSPPGMNFDDYIVKKKSSDYNLDKCASLYYEKMNSILEKSRG